MGFLGGFGAATPITAVISGILSGLRLLFGGGKAAVDGVVQAVRKLAAFSTAMFSSIKSALEWVWRRGIVELLGRLHRIYQVLRFRIGQVLGPIIRYLRLVRDYYDAIFNRWIRPLLQLIQSMRRSLVFFRLLGLKWAARLDARLSRLQVRIAEQFDRARRELNGIIVTLQSFLDPLGLLHPGTYLWSVIRSLGDLFNVLHAHRLTGLGAADLAREATFRDYYSLSKIRARAALHRAGQLAPEEAEALRLMREAHQALARG